MSRRAANYTTPGHRVIKASDRGVGIEPSLPGLSGCSAWVRTRVLPRIRRLLHLLSYATILFWWNRWDLNPHETACKAGAFPVEPRPHYFFVVEAFVVPHASDCNTGALVSPGGIEPPTFALRVRYSAGLSYGPVIGPPVENCTPFPGLKVRC